MGIGRFAFTPMLPMMLPDGVIELASRELAGQRELPRLSGRRVAVHVPAWVWGRLPRLPPVDGSGMVRAGLVATAVLTLGMALPLPALAAAALCCRRGQRAGIRLRLGLVPGPAGAMRCRRARRRDLTGPGAGIVVSGLVAAAWCMGPAAPRLADVRRARCVLLAGLAVFGAAPAVGAAKRSGGATDAAAARAAGRAGGPRRNALLALAYGMAGFGYIVSATFLPVIAREAMPGSPWLDLFWPIFGLGIVIGALLATRIRLQRDMRAAAGCSYLVQGAASGRRVLADAGRLRPGQPAARHAIDGDHLFRDAGGAPYSAGAPPA